MNNICFRKFHKILILIKLIKFLSKRLNAETVFTRQKWTIRFIFIRNVHFDNWYIFVSHFSHWNGCITVVFLLIFPSPLILPWRWICNIENKSHSARFSECRRWYTCRILFSPKKNTAVQKLSDYLTIFPKIKSGSSQCLETSLSIIILLYMFLNCVEIFISILHLKKIEAFLSVPWVQRVEIKKCSDFIISYLILDGWSILLVSLVSMLVNEKYVILKLIMSLISLLSGVILFQFISIAFHELLIFIFVNCLILPKPSITDRMIIHILWTKSLYICCYLSVNGNAGWGVFKKYRYKLYSPRRNGTMNKTLISLKIPHLSYHSLISQRSF